MDTTRWRSGSSGRQRGLLIEGAVKKGWRCVWAENERPGVADGMGLAAAQRNEPVEAQVGVRQVREQTQSCSSDSGAG